MTDMVKRKASEAETALSQQFMQARDALPGNTAVAELRKDAFGRFDAAGLPTRRVEAWHYTDLRSFMGTALPAAAHEHVYADAYGNLVIESSAGYKRIIVGQGERAREVEDAIAARTPEVVYADTPAARHCPGVRIYKGRSYMYAVPRNVTPVLAGPECR